MKILHINTKDTGGAAIACKRIHMGLLKAGIDSNILFLKKNSNVASSFSFRDGLDPKTAWSLTFHKVTSLIASKIKGKNADRKMANMEYSSPLSSYDITKHRLYKEADIVQFNWTSGFLNEKTFFAKNEKPVVWRMADLYACGSGYHYEGDINFELLKKQLQRNFAIRQRALQNQQITFVPISNWVKQKAEDSPLIAHFPKKLIHNGLDFLIFKPVDKNTAREIFNLPKDKKLVLIGAESNAIKRKGFNLALEALRDIKEVQIVIFGINNNEIPAHFHHVGVVNDERLMAVLFSACDLFVMSSTEEAFGQVTIESIACGTPVASFPTGGSIDIIKEGVNGVLAENFTAEGLKTAIIRALLTTFDTQRLLDDVRKRFDINDKVNEYIQLYSDILNHSY